MPCSSEASLWLRFTLSQVCEPQGSTCGSFFRFLFLFLLSFVFCLLSFVFCLLSFVFCLLSFVFCLLSFVFCLLSFVFCLLSFVFCLLSFVFCLLSFVFCLLSFVFCLLSFVFCLLSLSLSCLCQLELVSAACGKFHAVILQEASDYVPHISAYFLAYTDNTDLAILLNKDTLEPGPFVTSFKVDSTSKNTWGMVLLIVRAMLRRPSLSGSPTVTLCSAHIHNVVAKKRDASTELLQFLHSKMLEYNVDFIGGDFNMSAFSTVSDVFSDPEFSAPGLSCLWGGLGALDEQYRECTGFLIMPKRPYEWRVDSHGCYKIDNSALGLGPRDQSAHLPVFLHLRNTNIPGPNSAMRSEQAEQRRLERKCNKERRQR